MKFDHQHHQHRHRWQQRDRTIALLAWACVLSVAGLGAVFYILARS